MSQLSLPMSVERWDFTAAWEPILVDAARFSLESSSAPASNMHLRHLHTEDCRVAATVRYEVEVGLDDASATATFYDPPISWQPLAGVSTHSDLWRDAVGPLGPASTRPQLLQLPDAEAADGRQLPAVDGQHAPLAPTDVPSTLDVVLPQGIRLFSGDTQLELQTAVTGDWRHPLAGARTGEDVRSLLAHRHQQPVRDSLRATGVDAMNLREAVPIVDGRLAVGDVLPLDIAVVGEEVQVEPIGARPHQRQHKAPHSSVGGLHAEPVWAEAADMSWWEAAAGADPRVQAMQSIIDAAEKSTGIKASSLNAASARPVVLLSLAFDASAQEPMLHDLPVREIKEAMVKRGLSLSNVGPEKNDLVLAARAGGMSAGGETVSHRVEAVVEGNPGEISRGEPGFKIISIAMMDTAAHEVYGAAMRVAEANQLPQWWKTPSPTKDGAPVLAGEQAPRDWNAPGDASALQRYSYKLLTGFAAVVSNLVGGRATSAAEAAGALAGGALLVAAVFIAALELVGRRPGGVIETVQLQPQPQPQPQPAQQVQVSAPTPPRQAAAASAATPATSPGRLGGRVLFKSTVRVRRFIEDAEELHDRRKHWRALSARNAANRRSSQMAALQDRLSQLDRALTADQAQDDAALELRKLLGSVGAKTFADSFEAEGFFSVRDLVEAGVSAAELKEMGMADAELRARVLAALNRESAVA